MKKSLLILAILLLFVSCKKESNPIVDEDHYEAVGIVLYSGSDIFLQIAEGKIDSAYSKSFSVRNNQSSPFYSIKFIGEDGKILEPPFDEPSKSFGFMISDTSMVELTFQKSESSKSWLFSLKGKKVGNTDIELRLNHNDHPDFKTPKIQISITD